MISEEEMGGKIEELQLLEHNLQNFLAQKQSFEIELNEVNNAIEELKGKNDEVYKLASGIMLKSSKEKLYKELAGKKKILEMRVKSIENQEKFIEKKSLELREEINKIVLKENKSKK